MRRLRGGAYLGPRAPARIHAPGRAQLLERGAVEIGALGLPHRLPVPVETDRAQVLDLLPLVLGTRASAVKVLDSEQEAPAARAREQPGQQPGTQAAEVPPAAGARRGAAGGGRPRRRDDDRTCLSDAR